MKLSMEEIKTLINCTQHWRLPEYDTGTTEGKQRKHIIDLLDTIESMQQEIEALLLDGRIKKVLYEKIKALQQENEQLRAQVARMRGALQKIHIDASKINCTCNLYPTRAIVCERCRVVIDAKQALAEIDKAIGGKEDA